MALRDQIIDVLRSTPDGLTDAELARRLDKNHAHVNMVCRDLEQRGLLLRDRSHDVIRNRMDDTSSQPQRSTGHRPLNIDADPRHADWPKRTPDRLDEISERVQLEHIGRPEWYAERSVQSLVVTAMARDGWQIERVADTASRERGVDVVARRGEEHVLVEVKGYPGTTYARGARAGETKPTHPSMQAGTYFHGGLHSCLKLREANPRARVVLALPDVPRYRSMAAAIAGSLEATRTEVWFLAEDGSCTA